MKKNTYGEGTIFQLANGSWRAKIPACVETGGKPKSFQAKTEKEIIAKVKKFKDSFKIGYAPQSSTYFDKYINYWLTNIKALQLKPTSFDRLESTINHHINSNIGNYPLTEITSDLIQSEVINKMMDDGLSYSSIKKAYDALNGCFHYATKKRDIYINPMELVVLPRKDLFEEKEIRIFTRTEIDNFISACTSKFKNGEYRYNYGYIFLIMLNTGIRAGEMLSLKWEDVDLNNNFIFIRGNVVSVKNRDEETNEKIKYISIEQKTAKTRSGTNREVPLNKNAIAYFKELKKIYSAKFGGLPNYVASKEIHSYITFSTLSKSYDKILNRANISPCGLHPLRHTYASSLFRNGVDIKIISEILGHSSVAVTYNTYIHIINEQKNIAVENLEV